MSFRSVLHTPGTRGPHQLQENTVVASKLTFINKCGGASKCPSCFFVISTRNNSTYYSEVLLIEQTVFF